MERRSRSLRSQVGKTPIQKPLCRLCECPTSDGHVLASQVDRFKLRKWAMEVMKLTEEDENLPDVVEEDALICYFCIWQAEFGDESGDETVAWWPKNLDLEGNAKVLREYYSVGEIEQCWVQLEEIDPAEYGKEIPKKRKYGSGVCLYCGNSYNKLTDHVKLMHKEAIKCGIWGCSTYFRTKEEKEQHMQQDLHEKREQPRERKNFSCNFCEIGKLYSSLKSWRWHMKHNHPDLPFACTHYGCKEYFKSKSEMILHINSYHKQGKNQDLFLCKHCEYFTTFKGVLRKHEEAKHMPKVFQCDLCDAKFGSKYLVNFHNNQIHRFDKCKSCGQDVSHGHKADHLRSLACSKCKLKFTCSGLYQLHRKSCKPAPYCCKECEESFNVCWKLNCHVRKVHSKTPNFRCDHCDFFTFEKSHMANHMQYRHLPKMIKCGECSKLFGSESILKIHKDRSHEYVRCAECAQQITRPYMRFHRTVKSCRRCKCKFKCRGLLKNHVCLQSKNYYCDMCPNFYLDKRNLYCHFVSKHIGK
ncbi:zinc finger protein 814-like [Cloeon dipterum]|uniref:zinc finger protein 814-like n=1 Tax=Cloeon dipterum TaxID=197152 RepID=UPI00321FA8F7